MSQRSVRLQTLTDDAVHLATVRCAAFNQRLTPAQIEVMRGLFETLARAACNVASQDRGANDNARERKTTERGFRGPKGAFAKHALPPPPPVMPTRVVELNDFADGGDDRASDRPTRPPTR
jgi:hypothetical protein